MAEIHTQLTGSDRGRRSGFDILNKSGIVLLVGCWEAFIEDLATNAFTALLESAGGPGAIPSKVLVLAARDLRDARDERQIWSIAQDGWRGVLKEHKAKTLSAFIDGFHSPRADKCDALFEALVDLKSLSSTWRWHRNTNAKVRADLTELITLRGSIAHRVSVDRYITKRELGEGVELVKRLATVSSNVVRKHLQGLTAKAHWEAVSYGSAE